MQLSSETNRIWLALGLASLAAVLVIDMLFPLGAVAGFLYIIIAVCGFFVSAKDAVKLASVATAANVLGYCLAPTVNIPEWVVAVSRGAAVFTTWLLIVSGIHFHKQSQAIIATIRESHERRRLALEEAEQAQRDRVRELQLLTDAIPMLIGYLDREERFRFTNAVYGEAYDLPLEQFQGRTVREIAGDEVYDRLQPHIEITLRGKRVQFEEPVFQPDGVHWWLFQFLPRRDDQDRVVGFYSLITDITGLKRSQEEVDLQREALALSNRRSAANEMAAALAHEMNQPLGTIAVYSGRLIEMIDEDHVDREDLLQAMQLMHDEALRAGQIVKRARAMVDDKPLQSAHIDPEQLLDSVRKICSTRAAAAQVVLNLHVVPNSESIYADPVQIQQVLVNLVANSVEASHDVPQDRRHITITADAGAMGARLTVADCGHGMSAELLNHIFEPHYTTKPDGLGIGLNIARSIVTTHGGKIWAAANRGPGVTFHVDLPPAPRDSLYSEKSDHLPLLSKST